MNHSQPVILSGGTFVSQGDYRTNWMREKDKGCCLWRMTDFRGLSELMRENEIVEIIKNHMLPEVRELKVAFVTWCRDQLRYCLQGECFFVCVFVMDFLKGNFSIFRCIHTVCQSSAVRGFERCFEVANRFKPTRRRQNHHLAILRASRTQNILSFYEPHLGNAKFLRGINEPLLGREKPASGIIKPQLGITKPTEELNMLHLEKEFCRIFFTAKVIIPIPGRTCAKAVAILWRRGNPRASSLRGNYYLRIVFDRSFHTTARFDVGASIAGVPRFGGIPKHSPRKSKKRRRDREPSRIAVKKDHEFYDKEKS